MPCPCCLSSNQAEFPSEINFRFPARKNWTTPTFWVFPKILVCLDCGVSLFVTPKEELARLAQVHSAQLAWPHSPPLGHNLQHSAGAPNWANFGFLLIRTTILSC